MKKAARILAVAVVIVMILAVSGTAFATGNYLSHSGTASYGYTTSDYVSQMNDTTLTCNYAHVSRGSVSATPKFGDTSLNAPVSFRTGAVLKLPRYSSVRYVRLYIGNEFPYSGTSISTQGNWTLTA